MVETISPNGATPIEGSRPPKPSYAWIFKLMPRTAIAVGAIGSPLFDRIVYSARLRSRTTKWGRGRMGQRFLEQH